MLKRVKQSQSEFSYIFGPLDNPRARPPQIVLRGVGARFPLMIGMAMIAEARIPKGYIYAMMAFSAFTRT
jgi:hypothetical protein